MQLGDLKIEVTRRGGELRLDWRGKSNEREPEVVLTPFLKEMGHRALHEKLVLRMHFEELEFFNSATITTLLQFVKEAHATSIPLHMFYTAKHKWQKIFFDALWIFESSGGLIKLVAVKEGSGG